MPKTSEDLIDALYKFYISQGFTQLGASYMIGSLIQESRLNPAVLQKGGVGAGLGQWSRGKNSYKALLAYAKKLGRDPNDFFVQAQFTVQQRPNVTKLFKNAQTVAQAEAAVKQFENFGKKGTDRSTTAATVLANVKAGKSAGTGLAGKVNPQLSDIGKVIKDLESKFSKNKAGSEDASCPADDASLNLYGQVINGGTLGPGEPTSIGAPDPNFEAQ